MKVAVMASLLAKWYVDIYSCHKKGLINSPFFNFI
jgi:hypothetical protein